MFRFLPCPGCCEWCCSEHWAAKPVFKCCYKWWIVFLSASVFIKAQKTIWKSRKSFPYAVRNLNFRLLDDCSIPSPPGSSFYHLVFFFFFTQVIHTYILLLKRKFKHSLAGEGNCISVTPGFLGGPFLTLPWTEGGHGLIGRFVGSKVSLLSSFLSPSLFGTSQCEVCSGSSWPSHPHQDKCTLIRVAGSYSRTWR